MITNVLNCFKYHLRTAQRYTGLLLLLTVVLIISPGKSAAQRLEAPLVGPIVAVTPAAQDSIHLHDIGGEATRLLSFGPGEHHVWDFSPDGCRVLFTLDTSGRGMPKLFSARLDGSDQRALVAYDELPVNAWGIWEPRWSVQDENGTSRIAFTMIREETVPGGEVKQTHHIGWINGEASAPSEPEFYSVTGREFTPQWSYDGRWLAYVSYNERVPGIDVFSTAVPTEEPPPGTIPPELPTLLEADLWVVSADAETKYRLTVFTVGSVRAPRWSPDGDLIGFVYSPSPSNDTLWMIGSQEGARPTQLSYEWNMTLDHTWLPDSTAMLASIRDFRQNRNNLLWRIPLIGNADEGAETFLMDDSFAHTDYPRFSPDGRYLAFRSSYSLIVWDTTTTIWSRWDAETPGNTPPVWSPATFAGEQNCT